MDLLKVKDLVTQLYHLVNDTETKTETTKTKVTKTRGQHEPPLTATEREFWMQRIKPGRYYRRASLGLKDPVAAQRVLYWLKREGFLDFDTKKFAYFVRTEVGRQGT